MPVRAVTGPLPPCPKWRTLYGYHTASSARTRNLVRYVFTGLILCVVVTIAALVPDDVSVVWQIAGSSVGKCALFLYLNSEVGFICNL